jgi:hypothetical protein
VKRKILLPVLVIAIVAVAAVLMLREGQTPTGTVNRRPNAPQQHTPQPTASTELARVPAHYETTPAAASLAPTLPPENFKGLTRDAYKAVGEMPQTIAQLPCYCHCDEGFGHKSLQSCFVDDHAAHCDICVKEALAAYKLQKQGLSAPQIRERIIAEYSNQ